MSSEKASCKTIQIEQDQMKRNRTLSNNESILNKNQVLENREIYLLEESNSQDWELGCFYQYSFNFQHHLIWLIICREGSYRKVACPFKETCRIKNEKGTNC